MPLETGGFINSLNASYPSSTDDRAQGDDHIRLIKSSLKATFPNITAAVTKTAAQLNSAPHDLTTLNQILDGRVVTAQSGFAYNGQNMAAPAPDIGLGWNSVSKRVHAKINVADYISGGFLTHEEFSLRGNRVIGGTGWMPMPGNMELHWGVHTVTYQGAGTTQVWLTQTIQLARAVDAIMFTGLIQMSDTARRSLNVIDGVQRQTNFDFQVLTSGIGVETMKWKWFAVCHRVTP